jgi:hypothetical protein
MGVATVALLKYQLTKITNEIHAPSYTCGASCPCCCSSMSARSGQNTQVRNVNGSPLVSRRDPEVRCTYKRLSQGTVDLVICHDNSEHVLGRIGFEGADSFIEVWGKYFCLKGLGILFHLKSHATRVFKDYHLRQ